MLSFLLIDVLDVVIFGGLVILVIKMIHQGMYLQRKREEAKQRRIELADERRYERESERASRRAERQKARNDRKYARQMARQESKLEKQKAKERRKYELQKAEIERNKELQKQQLEIQKSIIQAQINNYTVPDDKHADSDGFAHSVRYRAGVVALECPKCGAGIEVDNEDSKKLVRYCKYCGAALRIDDGSARIVIQRNSTQNIHISADIKTSMRNETRDHSKTAKYVGITIVSLTLIAVLAFLVFGILQMNGFM